MIIKSLLIQIVFAHVFLNQVDCLSFVSAPNYLRVVCDFLKVADICENGYRSKYLKINFLFGLNIELDCGFQNETVNDVYFKNDGEKIFLHSLLDLNLVRNHSNSSRFTSYFAFIPFTEFISLFNNKNVPLIFIYLPVSSSDLKLRIEFDDFVQQDYKANQTRKLNSNDFLFSRNCFKLNVTDSNKTSQLFGFYDEKKFRDSNLLIGKHDLVNRAQFKEIHLKDDKFYAHLSLPLNLKNLLRDDSFIYEQNKMDKNLFLRLKFTFENLDEDKIAYLRSGKVLFIASKILITN